MNVVAQIFGALATLSNAIGIQFKTKNKILISYLIAGIFFIISFLLLKSYSGVITSFVIALETFINYIFDKNNKKIPLYLIFTLLFSSLFISLLFYKSWYDIFSILACIPFVFMLIQKKEKYIRILTLTFLIFYTIFNYFVGAYTAFIGDILFIISTIISIIRYDLLKSIIYYNKSLQ